MSGSHLVAPGWTPFEFNHTGDLQLVEDNDQGGLVDVRVGPTVTVVDGLLAPGSWAAADSILGLAGNDEGSLEFATVDLHDGRAHGKQVLTGLVVDPETLADHDLDTGKDRMLLRYRDGTDNWLSSLDTSTHRFGPTISIDGLVSWAMNRAGDRIAAGTTGGVLIFDGARLT